MEQQHLIPTLLARGENVTLENIRSEIVRLGWFLNEVVKAQPLAIWRDFQGNLRSGSEASANPDFKINMFSERAYTCNGAYYGGNHITINIGLMAQWGDIVEVLLHELAHRMRPDEEKHSKAFWALLDQSLFAAYGVHLPTQKPPKGEGQYWRDWVASERIRKAHSWANVRPLRPDLKGSVFLYEKAA